MDGRTVRQPGLPKHLDEKGARLTVERLTLDGARATGVTDRAPDIHVEVVGEPGYRAQMAYSSAYHDHSCPVVSSRALSTAPYVPHGATAST